MEVILKENYPTLGYVGDVVKVSRGFARNFLIPRGVAIEASSRNVAYLNHIKHGINAKRTRLKAEAEELAKSIEKIKLDFHLKSGDRGKSFGSVTVKDIEVALAAQGVVLDRRQIRLPEVPRKAGEYKAIVKVHSDVSISVPFKVTIEVVKAIRDDVDGAEPKRKRSKSKKQAEVATDESPSDSSAEAVAEESVN